MTTLYVFCEGQTEQAFCNRVLFPHLAAFGYGTVEAPHTILLAHSHRGGMAHRGGVVRYAAIRRDITNTLKQRPQRSVIFTTMIDLYALPKDFPERSESTKNPADPTPYVEALERAFADDLGDDRFVPYLQLHEFEALLFADPDAFGLVFDSCDRAVVSLKAQAAAVPTIEHIDDGPSTAPSKRIIDALPTYQKTVNGVDIAESIGIAVLKIASPHFGAWVDRLEALGSGAGPA